MSFFLKNRPGHDKEDSNYCTIHNQRTVQLGNCLTCTSTAAIC